MGESESIKANREKDREEYVKSFGIQYDVYHSSAPNTYLIADRTVPEKSIRINSKDSMIYINIVAHDGIKGNNVRLMIPFEGLQSLVSSITDMHAKAALQDRSKKRYPSPSERS